MLVFFLFSLRVSSLIELFSLYVLFSQYRSCDKALENCFCQISSYSRTYLRVIYKKTKGQVPPGPLLGKQNIQAKEVYYGERSELRENARETEHPSHSRYFSRLPQMVWEAAHLPKFGYPSLQGFFFYSFPFIICCDQNLSLPFPRTSLTDCYVSSSFSCCSRRHIRRNLHQSQGCHTPAVWSSYLDSFQGKTLVTKQCRQTIQLCAAPSLCFHGYNITP